MEKGLITNRIAAIIVAGGNGSRCISEVPKQFAKLGDKYVIEYSISTFDKHLLIDDIYIVVHKNYYDLLRDIVQRGYYRKIRKILVGGKSRQESSKIGVFACKEDVGKVLIHDASRPFVSEDIITNVISALDNYPAVDVAIPSADTIIEVLSNDKTVTNIPPRKYLMRTQTPQGFLLQSIKEAHTLAENDGFESTEDCSLILRYGLGNIYVVEGSIYNTKITYPIDIHIADKVLEVMKKDDIKF